MMLRLKRSRVHCGSRTSFEPSLCAGFWAAAIARACCSRRFGSLRFSGSGLDTMTADDIDEALAGPLTEPQLREALAAGGIGIWSFDLASGRFAGDAAACRLWGLAGTGAISVARLAEGMEPADAE